MAPLQANKEWILATSTYGEAFTAAINKGEVYASQFHPEKSGTTGLTILKSFLDPSHAVHEPVSKNLGARGLAKVCKRNIIIINIKTII